VDSGGSAGRSPGTGSRVIERVELSAPGDTQPGPDQGRPDTTDDLVGALIEAFVDTFGDRCPAAESH
jgi:hypothetical protein